VQRSNQFPPQPLKSEPHEAEEKIVLKLGKVVSQLARHRERWNELLRSAKAHKGVEGTTSASRLTEVRGFGSNPGALRMFTYAPARLPDKPALVVVLHGCTQTAASYDRGTGWSTLADRHGFVVLLPEQQKSNNPNLCFNWFQPDDTRRGAGEALSIVQMVEKAANDYGVDRTRIFVTGLSAGGAMTSVLLATYPDVFAAGAIIAGLPYGAATNVQEAFESMFQSPSRPARAWGNLVRAASPHRGPWPRLSVWHGDVDKTVVPANAGEIVKQWTDVHGLPSKSTFTETVGSYPRQVWRNAAGEDVIESYRIGHMAHGAPLAVGDAQDRCGAAGPFLLDVGISSTYQIAKFWGLTDAQSTVETTEADSPPVKRLEYVQTAADAEEPRGTQLQAVDVKAIITQALTAAGLMGGRKSG
jgi:poly(hydroxyalkanoate) depolymerase family esterase